MNLSKYIAPVLLIIAGVIAFSLFDPFGCNKPDTTIADKWKQSYDSLQSELNRAIAEKNAEAQAHVAASDSIAELQAKVERRAGRQISRVFDLTSVQELATEYWQQRATIQDYPLFGRLWVIDSNAVGFDQVELKHIIGVNIEAEKYHTLYLQGNTRVSELEEAIEAKNEALKHAATVINQAQLALNAFNEELNDAQYRPLFKGFFVEGGAFSRTRDLLNPQVTGLAGMTFQRDNMEFDLKAGATLFEKKLDFVVGLTLKGYL